MLRYGVDPDAIILVLVPHGAARTWSTQDMANVMLSYDQVITTGLLSRGTAS